MKDAVAILGLAIGAYLLGSISTGLLIAHARGVELRDRGSGNVGATNAARVLGRRLGIVVFVGDAVKGAAPTLFARWLFGGHPHQGLAMVAAALGAIIGHMWPLWHGFRGGKGVSTAAGAFIIMAPVATLAAGVVWLGLFLSTRIASVASLVAASTLVAALVFLRAPCAILIGAGVALALVLYRHKANIQRLAKHTEPPLPPPPPPPPPPQR
jgi:glycerol-3-phosphate acyltransferase PlsY